MVEVDKTTYNVHVAFSSDVVASSVRYSTLAHRSTDNDSRSHVLSAARPGLGAGHCVRRAMET